MTTIEFQVNIDVPALDLDAFADLAEHLGEIGEEGLELCSDGELVYLAGSLDRPTLSEALLYTLHYLHDKNVPVKGVTAPRAD